MLEDLELQGSGWQTPKAHVGNGPAVLEASKAGGLEGVVAKRTSSMYSPGKRSKDWLKIKNTCRQEVVVGGWLPGAGNRTGRIGALLAGYHDDEGRLRFAGKVGTGFSDAELTRLGKLFEGLARDTSPFVDKVPYKLARFLEPDAGGRDRVHRVDPQRDAAPPVVQGIAGRQAGEPRSCARPDAG